MHTLNRQRRARRAEQLACGVLGALAALAGCAPRTLGSYESAQEASEQDAGVDAAPTGHESPDAAPPLDPVECRVDAQCDDADPCNGEERCVREACVPGSPPCVNTDTVHCQAVCKPHGGAALCDVVPRDADHDGFGDPQCRQAAVRGLDCDDGRSDVHPEAEELCDARDNDCDGSIDLEDGLPVLREAETFTKGQMVGAAASSENTVGALVLRAGEAWFATLGADGKTVREPLSIGKDLPNPGNAYAGTVGWGHDAFAVAWSTNGYLGFRTMTAQGEVASPPIKAGPEHFFIYGGSRVARVGDGDWLLLYECCSRAPTLYGQAIDPQLNLVGELHTVGAAAGANLSGAAVSGDMLGVAWWRIQENPTKTSFVEWTRRTAELEAVDDVDSVLTSVTTPGQVQSPVIAASPEGFAMAWGDSLAEDATQHLRFAEFDREGNRLCGPVDLSAHFPPGTVPVVPRELVARAGGHALVADVWLTDQQYAVDIVEVRAGCEYGQRFRVGASHGQPHANLVVRPGGDLTVLWNDYAEGDVQAKQRALGPTFCD